MGAKLSGRGRSEGTEQAEGEGCVVQVWTVGEQGLLGDGTGMFYLHKRDNETQFLFLVVQRSLLVETLESDEGVEEPSAEFELTMGGKDEHEKRIERMGVPLCTPGRGKAVWVESTVTPEADVALVPLPRWVGERAWLRYLQIENALGGGEPLPATTPVHAVGFPRTQFVDGSVGPVWQTGRLGRASDSDAVALPVEMVACRGVGGAPVFGVEPSSGGMRWLGIYTGSCCVRNAMEPKASTKWGEGSMELWGQVWKASVIEEAASGFEPERWQREVVSELPSKAREST